MTDTLMPNSAAADHKGHSLLALCPCLEPGQAADHDACVSQGGNLAQFGLFALLSAPEGEREALLAPCSASLEGAPRLICDGAAGADCSLVLGDAALPPELAPFSEDGVLCLLALPEGSGPEPSRSFERMSELFGRADAPVALDAVLAAMPQLCKPHDLAAGAPCAVLPLPLAAMFGMLAADVRWRAMRAGVLLMCADRTRLYCALVFKDAVYAFLELPTERAFAGSGLAPLLDDFRLGWLPAELLQAHGGRLCGLGQLPPEAEGFLPAFAAGSFGSVPDQQAGGLAGNTAGNTAGKTTGSPAHTPANVPARVLADMRGLPRLACRGLNFALRLQAEDRAEGQASA